MASSLVAFDDHRVGIRQGTTRGSGRSRRVAGMAVRPVLLAAVLLVLYLWVHAQSLDIWLVSAGSATAITGGQMLDAKKRTNSDDAEGTSIKGGVEQPLKAGDVLYVPPGVPHGFKDIQGFHAFLIRFETK